MIRSVVVQPSTKLISEIGRYYYRRSKAYAAGTVREQDDRVDALKVWEKFSKDDHERLHQQNRDRRKEHSASNIGSCVRERWFKFFGAPAEAQAWSSISKMMRIFENGDSFHTRMQVLFERMGILVHRELGMEDKKFGRRNLRGTLDAWVKFGGEEYLVELKSAGNNFNYLHKQGPSEQYLMQCAAYLHLASLYSKNPPKKVLLLYESKTDQRLAEYEVTADMKTVLPLLRLNALNLDMAIESRRIPARPYDDASTYPCQFCAYRNLCYNKSLLRNWMETSLPPASESGPRFRLRRT